jgi:ABC-2 type transport system ATP-binding protein
MEDRVDRDAVIAVANLTAIRGGRRILDDVSFDVRPGEILGVIGPNGAGKTTLFECIAGLQPITSGTIDRGEGLFYMPDGVKPWPDQTVRWTLDVFAKMYGSAVILSRADGEGAVASCAAPEVTGPSASARLRMTSQRVSSLSKGETKRLDIALALLTPHPVLFLDEPFDGLDLRQVRATIEQLREVARNGRTLVLSIHQLTDAARVCDRLLLLNNGRVIATGTPAELGDIEEAFLALT